MRQTAVKPRLRPRFSRRLLFPPLPRRLLFRRLPVLLRLPLAFGARLTGQFLQSLRQERWLARPYVYLVATIGRRLHGFGGLGRGWRRFRRGRGRLRFAVGLGP